MNAQIDAAEQYLSLIRNPHIIIRSIEQILGQLSRFVPDLLFKKFEEFGWKREGLEETEIKDLISIQLYLSEQLQCFRGKLTSRFELDLLLKKGGSIKIPCRIN